MDFLQKIKDFFTIKKIGGGKMNKKNLIENIIDAYNINFNFDVEKYYNDLERWNNIYKNTPYWKNENTNTLNIGASICTEIAQTATIELKLNVNAKNEDIKERLEAIYNDLLDDLTENVEICSALGGVIFKPFVQGNNILVDCITPLNFIPLQFDGKNNIIGALFFEQVEYNDKFYIRIEKHEFVKNIYVVTNDLYTSMTPNTLGQKIPINTLDIFKNLKEEAIYYNLDKPLFTYLKTPIKNNIDYSNPLGISHFYRAIELIKNVDEQYTRLLWEFEGSELAVHIEESFLITHEEQNNIYNFDIAKRRNRLYRKLNTDTQENFLEVFAPNIRDTSIINGLNEILKKIENTCGLVHGTFSNAETEARTATEIKLSKQRNYITITSYQKKLKKVFNDLLYIFKNLLYYMGESIDNEEIYLLVDFDDSVITDIAEEFSRRLILHQKGLIKDEELRAWYMGETEEEAKENIPPKTIDYEIE